MTPEEIEQAHQLNHAEAAYYNHLAVSGTAQVNGPDPAVMADLILMRDAELEAG